MKKVYRNSKDSGIPLSGAIEVGDTLYVSGQIHINEDTGEMISGTIAEKTHYAMKNIEELLTQAGYSFDDVVQTTVYLPNLSNAPEVEKVYESYFQHPLPTCTMVGVAALPLGADVEITVVARKI